jgi:hypothetical protein
VSDPLSGANKIPIATPAATPASKAAKTFVLSLMIFFLVKNYKIYYFSLNLKL